MKRKLLLVLFLFLALTATLGVMVRRPASTGAVISPEIVSFTATPREINRGQSATLVWATRGADSVAMEWGPGLHPRGNMQRRTGLPPSGTMNVQPEEDTVYVLECNTDAEEACTLASVTVRVK
jgi:hypothetical protein